jgi:hypothetical protein
MMSQAGVGGMRWRCVEAAAVLLAPVEREVVLGDLAETECSVWRGLGDVLSLAARRQLALWKGLAAVGSIHRAGAAGKPVPDGMVGCSERGRGRLSGRTSATPRIGTLSFQAFSCDVLGMDGRVLGGLCFAGHALGQRAGVLRAMSALLVAVAWAWAFFSETAGLSASRCVGSLARTAGPQARPGRGGFAGGSGTRISYFGHGRIDVQLLAVVARLVPDSEGETRIGVDNQP